MINDTAIQQGAMPTYQQINEFACGECGGFNVPRSNAIQFGVTKLLTRRKIYGWLWADVSDTTNFWVIGSILFTANNSPSGKLSIATASGTNVLSALSASLSSVLVSGGIAVQDSIGLFIAKPTGSEPSSVILQPLYCDGEFDQMALNIDLVGPNVTNIRAWLGIISGQ